MIKCIFLDLDGTVLDFHKAENNAFFQTMKAFDIPAGEQELRTYHNINAALWRKLERGEIAADRLRVYRWEQFLGGEKPYDFAGINACYLENLAQGGFTFPGASELVKKLSEKYKICVLTNGHKWSQEKRLKASGLAPYIDFMITSEEAGTAKPAPKMFYMAMERLGDKAPEHYIMIGDSLTADIKGAAAAGVSSIWYHPGNDENSAEGIMPTYTVVDYAGIARILL